MLLKELDMNYVAFRMWKETRDKLLLLKGIMGSNMVEIVNKMVDQKIEELDLGDVLERMLVLEEE